MWSSDLVRAVPAWSRTVRKMFCLFTIWSAGLIILQVTAEETRKPNGSILGGETLNNLSAVLGPVSPVTAVQGVLNDILDLDNSNPSSSGFLSNAFSSIGNGDGLLNSQEGGEQSGGALRKCEAGQTFRVESTKDLEELAKLGLEECVYATGLAPLKPPLGLYFGNVLKLFNTERFNDQIRDVWSGKLAFKSQCKQKDTEFYMVLNFVANDFGMPALMYVGTLADPTSTHTYDDGKEHLFIDYTPNMAQTCPLNPEEELNLNLGIVNDFYPINTLIDLVRVVGKTPDGGHIMLGKSIARSLTTFPESGDRTVAFWYVVNYDDDAYPEVPNPLGPLAEPFTYRHDSFPEFLRNYVHFSDLLQNPLQATAYLTDILFRKPMGLPLTSARSQQMERLYPMSGIPAEATDEYRDSSEERTNAVPAKFEYAFSGRVNFDDAQETKQL